MYVWCDAGGDDYHIVEDYAEAQDSALPSEEAEGAADCGGGEDPVVFEQCAGDKGEG
jgi:hypothetical protein